jgi:hypothetical protein
MSHAPAVIAAVAELDRLLRHRYSAAGLDDRMVRSIRRCVREFVLRQRLNGIAMPDMTVIAAPFLRWAHALDAGTSIMSLQRIMEDVLVRAAPLYPSHDTMRAELTEAFNAAWPRRHPLFFQREVDRAYERMMPHIAGSAPIAKLPVVTFRATGSHQSASAPAA